MRSTLIWFLSTAAVCCASTEMLLQHAISVGENHFDLNFTNSVESRDGFEKTCQEGSMPILDLGFTHHKETKGSLSKAFSSVNSNEGRHASEVVTVVSGYWNVDTHKYSTPDQSNPYERWLYNSLRLHMPYVMFTDQKHSGLIQDCRKDLPTLLVLRNQSDFLTHTSYNPNWTHSKEVPSAALAKVWLEKANLLLLASQLTNTTHYAWVDAGFKTFRNTPFPPEEWSLDAVMALPAKRISYIHAPIAHRDLVASVLILRRELIPVLHKLFYEEYELCIQTIQDWRCGVEEYLLTEISKRMPHLFHPMSYEYGDMSLLWAGRYPFVPNNKP